MFSCLARWHVWQNVPKLKRSIAFSPFSFAASWFCLMRKQYFGQKISALNLWFSSVCNTKFLDERNFLVVYLRFVSHTKIISHKAYENTFQTIPKYVANFLVIFLSILWYINNLLVSIYSKKCLSSNASPNYSSGELFFLGKTRW